MGIQQWSENIIMVELASAEPELSEELNAVIGQLNSGAACHVIVNMADTKYINSSNIAQLLKIRESVIAKDHELKLVSIQPAVHEVMATTRLENVFDITDNLPMAIASLQLTEE